MATLGPAVTALLASQFGVASRRQLTELATAKAVDGWVRHGLLTRMHCGVYRIRGAPASTECKVMAAVLRCGDDAVAGPRTSAALHGLEGFDLEAELDVVAGGDRRLRPLAFPATHVDLEGADRCVVAGLPALAVALTLLLLASELTPKQWRVAFDSARRRRLITHERLERRAREHPELEGSAIVLGYLASGLLDPDGEGERRLLREVLADFSPQPEWDVSDLVPGRRLDCCWRNVRLALEYDGRDHHVLPTDRDSDGFRDLECELHGVKVLRITKGMLDANAAAVRDLVEQVYYRRLLQSGA